MRPDTPTIDTRDELSASSPSTAKPSTATSASFSDFLPARRVRRRLLPRRNARLPEREYHQTPHPLRPLRAVRRRTGEPRPALSALAGKPRRRKRIVAPSRRHADRRGPRRAMISVSDNAATNQLIDRLGIESINDVADRLGMDRTRLARKMMATLEDTKFEESDIHVPDGEPTNATTPLDCARFFADLVSRRRSPRTPTNGWPFRSPNRRTRRWFRAIFPTKPTSRTKPAGFRPPHSTPDSVRSGSGPTARVLSVHRRRRLRGEGEKGGSRQTGADAADAIAEIGDAMFSWLR